MRAIDVTMRERERERDPERGYHLTSKKTPIANHSREKIKADVSHDYRVKLREEADLTL